MLNDPSFIAKALQGSGIPLPMLHGSGGEGSPMAMADGGFQMNDGRRYYVNPDGSANFVGGSGLSPAAIQQSLIDAAMMKGFGGQDAGPKPQPQQPMQPGLSGLAAGTGPLLNPHLQSTPEVWSLLGGYQKGMTPEIQQIMQSLTTQNFGFPQGGVGRQ